MPFKPYTVCAAYDCPGLLCFPADAFSSTASLAAELVCLGKRPWILGGVYPWRRRGGARSVLSERVGVPVAGGSAKGGS